MNHNRSVGHELIEIGPIPIGEDHNFCSFIVVDFNYMCCVCCHFQDQSTGISATLKAGMQNVLGMLKKRADRS